MPVFEFDGQRFNNPVELSLHLIGGKWKMPILWRLRERTWRYNELRRDLSTVNHKMLTQQLRELERAGLITRTVYPVVPPHVEYALSSLGETAIPCIEVLRTWGSNYRSTVAASAPEAVGPDAPLNEPV
jgi:DNA-binding HxlR family transcriptional regulator